MTAWLLFAYFALGAMISLYVCAAANWAYLGVGLKVLAAVVVAVLWFPLWLLRLCFRSRKETEAP